MPSPSLSTLIETLRSRVLRGLQGGTLDVGDRLPSARELVLEFGGDHRMVLAAYRELSRDGLVEIRERGGVYVLGTQQGERFSAAIPERWIADSFAEGYARGIMPADLPEWFRRASETARLRAVVIATTEDQIAGLVRELNEDFGIIAEGISAASAVNERDNAVLKKVDLFVTTEGHRNIVESLGTQHGKEFIVIDVHPDIAAGEWALLLRAPVWAVVATKEFAKMLKHFFAGARGVENLNVLVYGEDDLSLIPPNAPTYVTHRVRESAGITSIRGRILPPARTISIDSARRIFEFMVNRNVRAWLAMHPGSAREGDGIKQA